MRQELEKKRPKLGWYEKTDYLLLLSRQSGGALKQCALSTLQGGCCVDTRSFAEVAEVTQRKFCQGERCRARQRPQEYVLCVYVWLYNDSFYQIRDEIGRQSANRRGCGPRRRGRFSSYRMRWDATGLGTGVTSDFGGDKDGGVGGLESVAVEE